MLKAVIIDDEPLARSLVLEYLRDFPAITVAGECNDGFEGVKAVLQQKPDLIFLDIQMPKITGFEMLELLEEPPAVIFTTAFDEFAIRAFETHAVDYLLKPFSRERFGKAVSKFLDQASPRMQNSVSSLLQDATHLPVQSDRVVVKTAGKIKIIPFSQIRFLEASDDYVKVHTNEGSFLKNRTMGWFESMLPPQQFIRTHRSYMVHLPEITRLDPYEKETWLAILRSGQKVPVSKTGYAKLKLVLGL